MDEEERKLRLLFTKFLMPAVEGTFKEKTLTDKDREALNIGLIYIRSWLDPVIERMRSGTDVWQDRSSWNSDDSPNLMALRSLILGVISISAIGMTSKSVESFYREKILPEAGQTVAARAREGTERRKLKIALDEVVPAIAGEYIAKNGIWILGKGKTASNFALKLIMKVNLRLEERGLGPVKDGAIRKRLSPFISTAAPL